MVVLGYVVASFLALFILWVMFVVVMTMKQLRDANRLSPFMIKVGEVIATVGLVWDVLCNIFVATFVFLEPPSELTVSARLQRLVKDTQGGWKTKLALWFAVVLMNPFCPVDDPHIKVE